MDIFGNPVLPLIHSLNERMNATDGESFVLGLSTAITLSASLTSAALEVICNPWNVCAEKAVQVTLN